jgi:endoglucanase
MVMGHIDEIGLVITHVDDEGFAWFAPVGGWDPEVLVGQRARVLAKDGPVAGVVGKKSRHLQEGDERTTQTKIDQMWIDIGAASGEEARKVVHTGDLAVLEQPALPLQGTRMASRAVDNRAGAWVAAEAVRLYAEQPGSCKFTAVASVSEETSFAGAHTTSFALAPDAAIAVDVTNATDYPSVSKQKYGHVQIGKGPGLSRGAAVHPLMFEMLIETAEQAGIPYQVEPANGHTWTDADAIFLSRAGVPSVVVSIPLRYMHSPNELLDLEDLQACAELVAAFARRFEGLPPTE